MCVNIHRDAGVLRPGGTAEFRVYIWDVYNMDCSGLILWDYYDTLFSESCALFQGSGSAYPNGTIPFIVIEISEEQIRQGRTKNARKALESMREKYDM
jgi:hypothetical protein